MEIKAQLLKPYTEAQKIEFITTYCGGHNNNYGYIGQELDDKYVALGYTDEEIEEQERLRKDAMTLTPADVERALYKAKSMDFDDLKELISQQITGLDTKALSIEFRAKDFYRGAKFGNNRLFDVIGNLLGYTSDDIDYLFEHKELPVKETEEDSTQTETE